MGEGVGNDDASRLLLQTVIADRACRVHRGLDIALFNDVLGAIGVMGPDPGQAVGLQFDLDRNALAPRRSPLAFSRSAACKMPSEFCTWWPISCAMT